MLDKGEQEAFDEAREARFKSDIIKRDTGEVIIEKIHDFSNLMAQVALGSYRPKKSKQEGPDSFDITDYVDYSGGFLKLK